MWCLMNLKLPGTKSGLYLFLYADYLNVCGVSDRHTSGHKIVIGRSSEHRP